MSELNKLQQLTILNRKNYYNSRLIELNNLLVNLFQPATLKTYIHSARHFESDIHKSLLQADISDVINYYNKIKVSYKNATVNARMNALSSIYSRLKELKAVANNPVEEAKKLKGIKNLKTNVKSYIGLTLEEIQKVISRTKDQRLSCIIQFLINTGCRISEVIKCKKADAIKRGNFYEITLTGKGHKERAVYLSVDFYNKILSVFDNNFEYLFSTKTGKLYDRTNLFKQIRRKFIKILGRNDVGVHTLRKFYITYQLERGVDLKSLSVYAGHSDIRTTARFYAKNQMSPEKALITI